MPFNQQPRLWVRLAVGLVIAVLALVLLDQFWKWEVARVEVPAGVNALVWAREQRVWRKMWGGRGASGGVPPRPERTGLHSKEAR